MFGRFFYNDDGGARHAGAGILTSCHRASLISWRRAAGSADILLPVVSHFMLAAPLRASGQTACSFGVTMHTSDDFEATLCGFRCQSPEIAERVRRTEMMLDIRNAERRRRPREHYAHDSCYLAGYQLANNT